MTDLTDKERRVYTAALMGAVRLHHHIGQFVTFYIGDEDVTATFSRLRFTHKVLAWESTTRDMVARCIPQREWSYWKGSE